MAQIPASSVSSLMHDTPLRSRLPHRDTMDTGSKIVHGTVRVQNALMVGVVKLSDLVEESAESALPFQSIQLRQCQYHLKTEAASGSWASLTMDLSARRHPA